MVSIGDVAALKSIADPICRWLRDQFRKPDLTLELGEGDPFEVTHPGDADGHAIRQFRLRVKNNGAQDYSCCLVKLEEMVRTDGEPFNNRFLPIGLRTQHQLGEQRAGGRFNLRAGESKLIEVVWLDERESDSQLVLQYESGAYPNCIRRADYSIRISVYGGGKPVTGRYRIYVDERGYLKMEENGT